MRIKGRRFLYLLFFFLPSLSIAQYTADWKSLEKHTEVPEWIRDAKFGIYCHWGVYAVPACNNEHYIQHMHNDTGYSKLGTAARHVAVYGPLDKFGYHDFIPMFKGEKFNADEWADLFIKGGAKFAGPVYAIFYEWPGAGKTFNLGKLTSASLKKPVKSVQLLVRILSRLHRRQRTFS